MNIAVIGAGISGLVVAHRLGDLHNVTLYEANHYLGGHANTVDVHLEGESHRIDTGFIVFNDWTYPNFVSLLAELNVSSIPTSMSFSLHAKCADKSDSGFCDFEYNGSSLNGLFSQRKNLFSIRFWRVLRDIVRFNRIARKLAVEKNSQFAFSDETTIAQFLNTATFSQEFIDYYLLPMGSAIWSCPMGKFEQFPLNFMVEFYNNHGLLNLLKRPQWRFVDGGSRTYVDAIAKKFRGKIRLNTPIKSISRTDSSVAIKTMDQETQHYDHVVFACHSDQALRLLSDPTSTETEILSSLPYEPNVAILHYDATVLPRHRRTWASWNYAFQPDSNRSASVTYCMNILQKIKSKHTFCVTLNGEDRIDPSKILGRFNYHHPVFTSERSQIQARHHELINVNHTSYAGAYWRNGFHEDGVVSALAVCEALNQPKLNPTPLALQNS